MTFGSPRETQFHASETDSLTCFTVHQRRNISGCSILERLLFSSSRAEANPCTHRVPLPERMLATHGFPQENQFHASEADSLISFTVHQRRNISGASILKRSSSSRAEANSGTHRVALSERMLATPGDPRETRFHASEIDSSIWFTVHQGLYFSRVPIP